MNPRYWPGRLEERHGDAEDGGSDAGVVGEAGVTLLPLVDVAVLPSFILMADGGVGDVEVETTAPAVPPLLEDAPTGTGADVAASEPRVGGGGGGGGPPPAV